jgi:hypothetical protein
MRARAGAGLAHVSTDYVFSGDWRAERHPYEIDDETGPTSVYGRSKLAGRAVRTAMPDAHVVRTSGSTGGDGDFVATMRRLAVGDGTVDVVADQIGSPTYVGDLAAALLQVADGTIGESVLHAANQGRPVASNRRRPFSNCSAPIRPGVSGRQRPASAPAPRPPYSALSGRRSAAAGLTPCGPGARRWRRHSAVNLYAVSDELVVVTVTSPGPHLDRFLASLSHATERTATVVMADNGSTDGTPEEALERHPGVRLLRTGANLGYGSAVNRAVAEYLADPATSGDSEFFVVANPDVQWGPGSIDAMLEAAGRWPRAGALGPLIRDPDGTVYPSARHQPSLIRWQRTVVGPI